MVARALLRGLSLPSCFPKPFLMPESSSTSRTAPPAMTPVQKGSLLSYSCLSRARYIMKQRVLYSQDTLNVIMLSVFFPCDAYFSLVET